LHRLKSFLRKITVAQPQTDRTYESELYQHFAEALRDASEAITEAANAMRAAHSQSDDRISVEDPGPIATRLIKQQIRLDEQQTRIARLSVGSNIAAGLIGIIGVLIGLSIQTSIDQQRSLKTERDYAFERTISWADSGRNYSLREVDLSKRNLNDLDLGADPHTPGSTGVDLTGAKLIGATLYSTRLVSATLMEADLSEAKLLETNLAGANLQGAILSNANLNQAKLMKADLFAANLVGAKLVGAKLGSADLGMADLRETDLGWADLGNADLAWAKLHGAKINSETQLDDKWRLVWEIVNHGAAGQNLRQKDLSQTDLSDADLSKANLTEVNLSHSHLVGADLREADLCEADLHQTDLRGADLRGTNLKNAILTDAVYDDQTQWPESFNTADTGVIHEEDQTRYETELNSPQ
jgi:uncharacterized protein YjbI with pentapeptide repeats